MSETSVNPGRVHQALTSYQLAMAMKGALELDLFTHISAGASTAEAIATKCGGTSKGVRVLCDYLTVHGFLGKLGNDYSLTDDTGPLLDGASQGYMGSVASFFTHPVMMAKYNDVAGLVRRGGAVDHTLAPDDPIWVEFARRMAPMFATQARIVASHVATPDKPQRVLDLAAGHGMFGIHAALASPAAQITFQDWANVLEVARDNVASRWPEAERARFHYIPGSAFDVDLGSSYDIALVPNFLHHFDQTTNIALLKKVLASLRPGGAAAVVEFVPNEDRITPPDGALFAMRMLGTTPNGDAYTFAELDEMLTQAGFEPARELSLAPAHQVLVLAKRP